MLKQSREVEKYGTDIAGIQETNVREVACWIQGNIKK
jgi:hypothetical protein